MKTGKKKTQKVFKAYFKSLISLDNINRWSNKGESIEVLTPYFLESIGEDEICQRAFQEENCYAELYMQPKSNAQMLSFIDFQTNFELKFALMEQLDEIPELTIAACISSKNAILLLQFEREVHVLVSNFKVERSEELMSELIQGKLQNDLALLLGGDHELLADLEDLLFIYE